MRPIKKHHYLFFLLILSAVLTASAQTLPYRQYSAEEGLGHSVVYSTFQDSKGYIWFSTDHGLSRFDGVHFTNYTMHDGLPSNFIIAVTETVDNTLWIATYDKGLAKFENDAFSPCRLDKNNVPDKLLQIVADKENRIWLKCGKGEIGYIERNSYKIFNINTYTKDTISYQLNSIYKKSDGSILFATNKGCFQFEKEKLGALLPDNTFPIYSVDEDNIGNLWLGSDSKIIKLSQNKQIIQIATNALKNKKVRNLRIDNSNTLWIGNYPEELLAINTTTMAPIYSDNIPVNDIFKDRENNVWVSTFGQGVYCFNASGIVNYTTKDGFIDNIVSEITEDSNKGVWVANLRGINYINTQTGKCSLLIKEKTDQQIYSLTTDHNGNLIYGMVHSIVIKEKKGDRIIPFENRLYRLYRDGKKTWIATDKGVLYYQNGILIRPDELNELKNEKVSSIFRDSKGTLWFGTNKGLYNYNAQTIHYIITPGDTLRYVINGICEDKSGTLWLATDKGISSLCGAHWEHYSSQKYMNNTISSSIIYDKSGNIWIGSNKGLFIFDGKNFRKLDHLTGLAGAEIQSLYIDSKNTLWVGTIKGLSAINLNTFSDYTATLSFPLHIEKVYVNGKAITAYKNGSLSLTSSENNISIGYVGLFYKNPQEIVYEYMLSGTSDNWTKTQNRSIEFSSLSPGNYTFLVRAQSADGAYSNDTAKFSFSIAPPFWASTWFILLTGILFITIIFFVFQWRIKTHKQKVMADLIIHKQLINLEHRALSALMNPHFIFNVLNSIQYYMKYVNVDEAHEYLKKFTKLIRLNFENAKQNYNSLENEIAALELYCSLEQLRFDDKFTFEVKISPEIETSATYIPSILIQPYVENAIWHGLMPKKESGKVVLNISTNGKDLTIRITDNGIGIDSSAKNNSKHHHSSAIKLTKERLRILEQLTGNKAFVKIKDLSKSEANQTGTEVEIQLPVLNKSNISDFSIS